MITPMFPESNSSVSSLVMMYYNHDPIIGDFIMDIYGSPLSSPTNKVRYVANYLKIPYQFHPMNLRAGDQRKPEYLTVNPLGKIPAINDNGFTLGESSAIIRYLASQHSSAIYPIELKERAIVDQWIDYASIHVMLALSRIMFNTYFYKLAAMERDERSLQDGRKFIEQYLPVIDQQLTKNSFIAGTVLSLADFTMLAALDVVELAQVDISTFSRLIAWRKKLMNEDFYQQCHESYAASFNNIMAKLTQS